MFRAHLIGVSFVLAVACVPDDGPQHHGQIGEPVGTNDAGDGDVQGGDAMAPGDAASDGSAGDGSSGDASNGDASSGDASSGDASSGDASTGDDASEPDGSAAPDDAGGDASGPDDAGGDASGPDDAGGDASGTDEDASTEESPNDASTRDAGPPHDPVCTLCGACEQEQPIPGVRHVDGDIVYPDPPPTTGDHNPCWTRYGVHDEQVPDERWVHNLEHGAVVFLYNCPNGCPNEIAQLRALVQACGVFAVLTPYDLLPKRFAVVSWGHRLVSDCLDISAFRSFYDLNVDHGSESNASNPPGYCPP
jgi:hypothetical protein